MRTMKGDKELEEAQLLTFIGNICAIFKNQFQYYQGYNYVVAYF